MKPMRSGVVATSQRLGPTRLFDEMTQMTAMCRAGSSSLVMHANGDLGVASYSGFVLLTGETDIRIDRESILPRGASAVELQLSRAEAEQVASAERLEVGVVRGPASGGDIAGTFDLSGMDRAMIAAAFRFCIDFEPE